MPDPSDDDAAVRPDAVTPAAGNEPADGLDLGGLLGEGGLDLGALLEQATAMQSQMAEAQQKAAESIIEGVAGGGVVKVTVDGTMQFKSVTIAPEVVDPDDVEMLQDLVLAALHHAADQVQDLQAGTYGGLDLGGLDLGGLGPS